jgi:hypothetical protein
MGQRQRETECDGDGGPNEYSEVTRTRGTEYRQIWRTPLHKTSVLHIGATRRLHHLPRDSATRSSCDAKGAGRALKLHGRPLMSPLEDPVHGVPEAKNRDMPALPGRIFPQKVSDAVDVLVIHSGLITHGR